MADSNIKEIRITDWLGGESESEFAGQKGSVMSCIGLDIFSEPNAVKLSERLAHEVSGPTELCKWACVDRLNNTYWFSSSSGKIWVRDQNGVWTQPYTIPTCNYVNGCGISLKTATNKEWIYFSYNSSANSYDHLCYKEAYSTGGPTNWSDVILDWKQLSGNVEDEFFTASVHPMVKQQGFLVVGNNNQVATISIDIADNVAYPSGSYAAAGTYNGSVGILLPAFAYNYEVSALSRFGDDILIGASKTGIYFSPSVQDYSYGYLSRWDLTSDGFTSTTDVQENGIYNIQQCEYGAYVFTGNTGTYFIFNGTNLSDPKNIRPNYTKWDTANGGYYINPMSVCNLGKYILVGVSKNSLFGETFDEGVYCLGHKVSSYPLAMTLQYPEPVYNTSLLDYWDGTCDSSVTLATSANDGAGQSFASGAGGVVTTAQFFLKKTGSPTGNAVAKLYAISGSYGSTSIPTGAAMATSDNLDVSTLTTLYQQISFTFSTPYTLTASTNYAVTIEYTGGDVSNYVSVGLTTAGSGAAHGGNASTHATGTWTNVATLDLLFFVSKAPVYAYSTAGLKIGAMVSIGSQALVSYYDNNYYSLYDAKGVASISKTTRCPLGTMVVNVMGDQDRNKTFEEYAVNYRVNPSSGLSMSAFKNYNYTPVSLTNLTDTNYNKIYSLTKIIASSIQMKLTFTGSISSYNTPVMTSLYAKFNEEAKT